jgi:hypothetical protein
MINNEAFLFAKINNFEAKKDIPKDLKSGREVNLSSEIPFLPIIWNDNVDWDKMLEEAIYFKKHYVIHRKNDGSGWSSIVLHGFSSIHTEAPEVYGYTNDNGAWRWTDVSEWCPVITSFFKNQFDYKKYYRIRIMKLPAGGYILPHQDSKTLNESHIGPVNIALNDPKDCRFYMDKIGYLPFDKHRIIKLNLYNYHSVFNDSNEDRYHIIVHGVQGNGWCDRIFESYKKWIR